jgi:molybdopterin-guanine dinucleotide biosynthesis protein A
MGEAKGLLPFEGTSMIEHILRQVNDLGDEILVIANDLEAYAHIDVPVLPDLERGLGALGGVYSALSYTAYDFVMVLACDMPFVNRGLYKYAMSLVAGYDAVVPIVKSGRAEPFRSIFAKACLGSIAATIDAGERRVTSFLPLVRTRYLQRDEVKRFDPSLISFFNVNSPTDLAQARSLALESHYAA